MYGAILGDIIGSPYAFDHGNQSKDFPLFSSRSAFTGDTVMTIAIADALMSVIDGKDDAILKAAQKSMRRWGRKYPDGGRTLVRCRECGALLLSQHSRYETKNPELDGFSCDWIPVWSEEEADLLNMFLDSRELPEYAFKHLRSDKNGYSWIGNDPPRPMDLQELARATAMKYEKIIKSSGDLKSRTDSSGAKDRDS